ncbi:LSU ribosomal protein L13P [Candidatus Methanoperedens nitroreducens]|uniref:Large ribosomal subunit protein uL13 n=1 Tax=Candidatus Methanoperedens nitratireducens TaxID=1392998 RepID=A0A062V662_9EURY|nr:50S ribosomal protein L13 [Candidatus Methanoperedens nitroreducens]KCZ72063.1 LSU ribosomal protein L13P [Candidatus Methanoperedens nitroreducens]MDJ1421962.1 50S ribosomal protein L13 [Candidatus Methanoperedens sp.]
MTVIDASNLILGRMASIIAQRLLNGEEIKIINAERAIISGRKDTTFGRYRKYANRGSREFGPHFPRRPDQIISRTVRGMIPHKKMSGREAYNRLRVYIGVPPELSKEQASTLEDASITRLSTSNYTVLGDLSKKLGSKF